MPPPDTRPCPAASDRLSLSPTTAFVHSAIACPLIAGHPLTMHLSRYRAVELRSMSRTLG